MAAIVMAPALLLASGKQSQLTPLENKVRHEIVMLPYIGVFDNISARCGGRC
jgi:hypothetical protein